MIQIGSNYATNDIKSPKALVNLMTKLAASYMKMTWPSLISFCKKIDGMMDRWNWMMDR